MQTISSTKAWIRFHLPQWGYLFLILSGTTLASYLLDKQVSLTSQAMVYVLAVAIASYTLDRKKSIIGALLAILAFNFFFVTPRRSFHIENSEHIIALSTMLIVAMGINWLATNLRNKSLIAKNNERQARQLQSLASALSDSHDLTTIMAIGEETFARALNLECSIALAAADGSLITNQAIDKTTEDGIRCCIRDAATLGPGSGRFEDLNACFFLIGSIQMPLGAVYVNLSQASSPPDHEHAIALSTLLSQAIVRLRLSDSMRMAQLETQKQQLQTMFLSAISHDLRTPLAVVIGAATSLLSQNDKLTPDERHRLLENIVDEANYLTTITENTLQLVRLSSTPESIHRDWESIEEIIGSVLSRMRQRDSGHRIISKVASKLPLLRVDPVLIAQLLSNLLDNALKYSEDEVELNARLNSKNELQIIVMDHGAGIPEDEHVSIFQAYSRLSKYDQSHQRSAGLGLAVCHAIVTAHQGEISVNNRANGGACFTIELPVGGTYPATSGMEFKDIIVGDIAASPQVRDKIPA